MLKKDEARSGGAGIRQSRWGLRRGEPAHLSIVAGAPDAMPLKGDFLAWRNRYRAGADRLGSGGSAILAEPGEVAEWLKAAPC